MNKKLFSIVMIIVTFLISTIIFAQSNKYDLENATKLAIKKYKSMPRIKKRLKEIISPSITILRTAEQRVRNYQKNFDIYLAIMPQGRRKPVVDDVYINTIRILRIKYLLGQDGSLEVTGRKIINITWEKVPQSDQLACYFVSKAYKVKESVHVCLPVTKNLDKLWLKLANMKIIRPALFRIKRNREIIFSHGNLPEECDGPYMTQYFHKHGWCPWSATFTGSIETSRTIPINAPIAI